MKLRLRSILIGLLLAVVAGTAVAATATAQSRKPYVFTVFNEFGEPYTDDFTVVVYDASDDSDITSSCYTSQGGTTAFDATSIATQIKFWTAYSTIDIMVTDDTNDNAVKLYDQTPTDHKIMLSRNWVVAGASQFTSTLQVDGAASFTSTSTFTGNVTLGADGTGVDQRWYSETTSDYVLFDQDANTNIGALIFEDCSITLNDDTRIRFGDGAAAGNGDLYLSSDSSNLLTLGQVVSGTGTFAVGVDGKGVDITIYGETASDYILYDQDANTNIGAMIYEDIGICLNDDTRIRFGDGAAAGNGDLYLSSSSAGLLTLGQVVSGTGTMAIGADDKGVDVTFYAENGSDKMWWDQDGATNVGALTLADSVILFDQASSDYTFAAASNVFSVTASDASTSAVHIGSNTSSTNGLDFIIHSKTQDREVTFNAGNTIADFDLYHIRMADDTWIAFGSGGDATLTYADSGDVLTLAHDDGVVGLGIDGGGFDMYWYTENTGAEVYFDEDNATVTFDAVDLILSDEDILAFGDTSDATLAFANATDTLTLTHTGGIVGIGTAGDAPDLYWYTEDAAKYVFCDEDNSSVTFTGVTASFLTTVAIGDAVTDNLTITSAIQGASPLVLDGVTDDTNETTIAVTDPSGDNTLTLPDDSGYFAYTPGGKTTKDATDAAIPLTHSIVEGTSDADSAWSLANGSPGQILTIVIATDGGEAIVTPATATGWATAVLTDDIDSITVQYVDDTVGWVILGTASDGTNIVAITQ